MKKKLHIVFLLDRSGSMYDSVLDTIGGYNNYLEKNKDKNAFVTTVLFDNTITKLYSKKPIKDINKLTTKDYTIGGTTAIYDAIGKTINDVEKENNGEKVLFIITTDGYENASMEYNKKMISQLISKHKDWKFIYLGANIDSYAEAFSIGIDRKNVANYSKSKTGINNMFEGISYLSNCVLQDEEIDSNWKKDLE